MKTAQEFRLDIYEKRDAAFAARKKARRRIALCGALAVVCLALIPLFQSKGVSSYKPVSGKLLTLRAQPGTIQDLSTDAVYEQMYTEMYAADKQTTSEDPDGKDVYEKIQEKYDGQIASLRDEREKNRVDPAFSQAVNQFAKESTGILAEDFEENACYSPLSLYYALSMVGGGAEGETKQEFLDVLNLQDMDWAAEQCRKFYRQHYHDNPMSTFRLANSLWLDDRCAFRQEFLDNASENYYASLLNADFTDPAAGETISGWISDNTGGLLSPNLEFDQNTVLALVNTIYLFEQWSSEFNQENNTEGDFTKADGSTVTAEYMHRTVSSGGAFLGDGYTRASLSLKQTGEMIFILPDEGTSVQELLQDPDTFEELFFPRPYAEAEDCKVEWSVPKFSFDAEYDLVDALRTLGLEKAFSVGKADFSGVGSSELGNLFLSQAKQGIHVGVNEEGVEAAAYTMLAMAAGAAMPPDNIVKMTLDRPFLFAILSHDAVEGDPNWESPSGTLLFIGVCGDPTSN